MLHDRIYRDLDAWDRRVLGTLIVFIRKIYVLDAEERSVVDAVMEGNNGMKARQVLLTLWNVHLGVVLLREGECNSV